MKKVLLLFFILTVSLKESAQDTIRVSQNELLNRENALARLTRKDTNRVKLLIDYANLCFYNLDFLNGLKAVDEARSISKEINFPKGEGLYLKSISIFRRRVNTFYELTQHAINIKNLDIYYEVEGNRILGQYTNFDVFGNINMPPGARDSEIETIKSNLEEALNFYSNKENLQSKAFLLEALSLVYFNSNKEKSNEYKIEAQSLFRKLGLSYHELILLSNDIYNLSGQGKEEEAKALEIEAIDIYTKESDEMIKAHCAFLLSRIYGYLNREKNLQLEYLFQAEELLAEINEKDLLKSVYLSAASVYEWFFTNSEKALEYEYKELNLRKEINYFESVAYTYLLISESLFGLNRIQDFPPEYKDYLKIGSLENSSFFDAEVLWVKARMLEAQGKSMEAQSVFQESITVYMTLKDKNGACWAAHDLAQSFKSAGDLKNAIKNAQISFDLANEIKLLTIQIRSSDLLSQLYEQAGQKEKAFAYLKQYRAFKDENDRLNNIAQRSELEVKAILKKRQREIELLETESQLKEQENKTQRVWLFSIAGALASLIFLSFVLVRNNRQKQKANQVLNSKNKELEIEAALERVRSCTMAMQKSNELADVVKIMYRQFEVFGMADWGCAIMIFDTNTNRIAYWVAESTNADLSGYYVNGQEHPIYKKLWKHWEEQGTTITLHHTDEFKKEFDEYWLNETDFKRLPEEIKASVLADREIYLTYAPMRYGLLNATGKTQLPKDQMIILERFAKVFEQTYTRFLDLQKAEAQAREAQIEVSLERVRARAMSMQKSDELGEAAELLYKELQNLGISGFINCGYLAIDEQKQAQFGWITNTEGIAIERFYLPLVGDPVLDNRYAAWKRKEPVFCQTVGGDMLKEHLQFVNPQLGSEEAVQNAENNLPDPTIFYCGNFSHGYLCIITGTPFTAEKEAILARFTKVFEQTYTRFLDLQKAEEQAREAEIELALERVRARTMAMQKSDELREVASALYEQMSQLKLGNFGSNLVIFNEDEKYFEIWVSNEDLKVFERSFLFRKQDHPMVAKYWSIWKNQEPGVIELKGSDKIDYDDYVFNHTDFKLFPEEVKKNIRSMDNAYFSCIPFSYGLLVMIDNIEPLNSQGIQIIGSFAKVFDQTYTRFLDLQKAEAQAREAQIEAALERVRSRTMTMHNSDELGEVAILLYKEFNLLIIGDFFICGFVIVNEAERIQNGWLTQPEGTFIEEMNLPYPGDVVLKKRAKAWKERTPVFCDKVSGEKLEIHIKYVRDHSKSANQVNTLLPYMPDPCYFYCGNFAQGYLHILAKEELRPEDEVVLSRFTKVFEQTYTRFLDLQKAEAQTREAQIEAALERVRSKTMAMHNSNDVGATVLSMFDELISIGVDKKTRCGIGILGDTDNMELWTASTDPAGKAILHIGNLDMTLHPLLKGVKNAWRNKEKSYTYELTGEDLVNYFTAINNAPDYNATVDLRSLPEKVIHNDFTFSDGTLFVFTETPIPDELANIFKRFTGVFGQTYRRYMDLLKAEAQAREAQIEAALERVRSRTMAMQKSEDLNKAASDMFKQIQVLGMQPWGCGFNIFDKDEKAVTQYMSLADGGISPPFRTPLTEDPFFINIYDARQRRDELLVMESKGESLAETYRYMFSLPGSGEIFGDLENSGFEMPKFQITHCAYFSQGYLVFITYEPVPEAHDIFKRFAKVFEQTYTRFLDLHKSEVQAREAQIEAALERVRSRAMAMQKPGELVEVAQVLRKEMGLLGVEELETSSIYIHNETTGKTECWFAIQDQQEKKLVADHMFMDLNDTRVGKEMLAFYHSDKKQTSILMQGEARKEWIHYCAEQSKLFGSSGFYGDIIPDRTYHLYKFSNGYMGAASPGDISAESWNLLQRATSVFSLAYTRFSDLQKAEASTKEVVKQAALDRIRADIASMRTISDLDRITPLIWNELTVLGIPFIRCGVFIMDEEQQLVHTFLSTPEGKAIAAFHLPYDTPGNLRKAIENWHLRKKYIDHWGEEEFTQFAEILAKQGALQSAELYLKTIPHGGFYLHFLPFLQGMLYAGNTTQLSEDEINLVQSVAEAFSTAYARYEDFNKLEAAKKQVDITLNELQVTQKQLIQSEKMASLGELTAGIAHEIQNPLNFVNNFSEVSNELLDEMMEEVAKGNFEEVKEILNDVKQNLEKINQHGKRADGIVKGMLQHSRSSSGVKEPTDINALADEYLRLAFHGLRAKDKSFNSSMKTDFDESIGKINIIPQDIGRVILNLITNAFYAVNERKKTASASYEPTVTITTISTQPTSGGRAVTIKVSDNGGGIPQKLLDKIFQPFFTTKPTGQGTGLGLSLSYDIVKAHGGELRVETKEGEGTKLVIQLPINTNNG